MQTNTQVQQDDLLTIDPSAYFEVDKKQLFYWSEREEDIAIDQEDTPVNRYALVRKDNGKLLGIHSDDYIVRPYSDLSEKVNNVILDAIPDINKWQITTEDHVYADGKKFRRNINFWNKQIYLDSHERANECIIPQVRIYSSLDGQWGQQIMFSSIYMWCLNGMVRPDWTFTVYNKHSSKQDITYSVAEFRDGLESHKEMGNEMFKMMQKKVRNNMLQNYSEKHWLTIAKEISISIITLLLSCVIWTLYGVNMLLNMAILFLRFIKQRLTGQHTQSPEELFTMFREREKNK